MGNVNFEVDVSALAPKKARNGEILSPLDQGLKALNRTFKFTILPEVKARGFYRSDGEKIREKMRKSKRRQRTRDALAVQHENDPLAEAILDRIRRRELLAEEITVVNGILPEGDELIRGVVTIMQVEHTERYVLGIDKVKQLSENFPRFSFPGGRVAEGESLSRTTIREIFEETKLNVNDLGLKFYFVGIVPIYMYDSDGVRVLSGNDKVLLLYTRISETAATMIKPGKEQYELRVAGRKEVEGFSERSRDEGELLPNHRNYWFVFKLWEASGMGKPLGDIRAS